MRRVRVGAALQAKQLVQPHSLPPARDRRRASRVRLLIIVVGCAGVAALLSGCGKQSELSGHSPIAHDISLLWWWMLGAAAVVFFGTVGFLVVAWFRRDRPGLPFFGERETLSEGLVLIFGIGIPVVVLVALFGAADVYLVGKTSAPNAKTTSMTVDVIGHQWWWEVRYPGTGAVTANEIHIPTSTRVNVVTTTADVIHSFWVPELSRKVDMTPGYRTRLLFYTTRAGTYRGQCAEFCGFQHAHMSLTVVAQPPAQYQAWLRNMAASPVPASGSASAGQKLFTSLQCASCHQIRGVSPPASVGPDLTHVASRSTLAAVTIPNNPTELAAWIANPQAIKPGNRMPDLGLSKSQVAQIVAYLETLR
jgi:cytochrome c oxidase subunit 2